MCTNFPKDYDHSLVITADAAFKAPRSEIEEGLFLLLAFQCHVGNHFWKLINSSAFFQGKTPPSQLTLYSSNSLGETLA